MASAEGFSEDTDRCPICRETAGIRSSGDVYEYLCPRCGRYDLTGTAQAELRAVRLKGRVMANAAGWIREHQGVRLTSREKDTLTTLSTPTVGERAAKVLRELARRYPEIGTRFDLNFGTPAMMDWAGISWSESYREVEYLFSEYLMAQGLIGGRALKSIGEPGALGGAYITPKGHAELERLAKSSGDGSMGFCAMWFDPSVNSCWTDAIFPAIRDAGYRPERVDQIHHNNKIDDEIIAAIRKSHFVVADFTGNRGGVYFEAGVAMGFGKPVVWTIRSDQLKEVHFDNRQYNFIVWDPADLKDFKKRLQNRVEATIGRGPLT